MTSKLKLLSGFFLLFVACAWGLTRTNSLAIWNSTIDNTPIGQTAGNTGTFTSVTGNSGLFGALATNGHASSYTGAQAAYYAFNYEGTGDADMIAANGGSTPRINFYYLLGGALTKEMWLDGSAILNVPNGINANLNGNITGNAATATTATTATNATTATTATSTSGNAATATQLATAPSNCGAGVTSYGIGQNGTALCNTTLRIQGLVITSGICTTANGAGGTCSFGATWPVAFTNSSWAGSCTAAPPSGSGSAPSLNVYISSKAAQTFSITLQGGQSSSAGSNTTSEIDCVGQHT